MDKRYTDKDEARMRYYYKEMVEKATKYPNSLPLHNGIVRIEQILGLAPTREYIDALKKIDEEIQKLQKQKEGL